MSVVSLTAVPSEANHRPFIFRYEADGPKSAMRHLVAPSENSEGSRYDCDLVLQVFPASEMAPHLDPQGRLSHPDFLILDLNGHVIDLELFFQDDLGAFQDRRRVFHVGHDKVFG